MIFRVVRVYQLYFIKNIHLWSIHNLNKLRKFRITLIHKLFIKKLHKQFLIENNSDLLHFIQTFV